jgi:hypothetical protein
VPARAALTHATAPVLSEIEVLDDGKGTMEALYFGSAKGGLNHGGVGPGPWIMGDLEQGLWGSDVVASQEPTITATFVTAMFKGDSGPSPGHMAIKGGDAQKGELTVYYDGVRPVDYSPMKKQGSLILGIGGDNSNGSEGTFYEGAVLCVIASRGRVGNPAPLSPPPPSSLQAGLHDRRR